MRRSIVAPRARREEGFTIFETVMALALFGILIVGITSSATGGLKMARRGDTRQFAAQLATGEMEKVRRLPYAKVALKSPVTWSTADLDSLDSPANLDVGGLTFTPPEGNPPTPELLVTDSAGGVAHGPEATSNKGATYKVWRYVTWGDSVKSYKRVTIAVDHKDETGKVNRTVVSSIFSVGQVTW